MGAASSSFAPQGPSSVPAPPPAVPRPGAPTSGESIDQKFSRLEASMHASLTAMRQEVAATSNLAAQASQTAQAACQKVDTFADKQTSMDSKLDNIVQMLSSARIGQPPAAQEAANQ